MDNSKADPYDQEAATQMIALQACDDSIDSGSSDKGGKSSKACPKQLQLPMFLSSKCHPLRLIWRSTRFQVGLLVWFELTCLLSPLFFLAETYHMIDRCDSEVAAWSDAGDNFVVKNVEKFATVSC
jgi:hypothetical protein